MLVCLARDVGSLVASDKPLTTSRYVECDGRVVSFDAYPELFIALHIHGNKARLPDMRSTLDGMRFWLIAKSY